MRRKLVPVANEKLFFVKGGPYSLEYNTTLDYWVLNVPVPGMQLRVPLVNVTENLRKFYVGEDRWRFTDDEWTTLIEAATELRMLVDPFRRNVRMAENGRTI